MVLETGSPISPSTTTVADLDILTKTKGLIESLPHSSPGPTEGLLRHALPRCLRLTQATPGQGPACAEGSLAFLQPSDHGLGRDTGDVDVWRSPVHKSKQRDKMISIVQL
jgi:hypothetical protein